MTYQDAKDAIFGHFLTNFNSDATSILGYIPTIYWPGQKKNDTQTHDKVWARLTFIGLGENQHRLPVNVVKSKTFDVTRMLVVNLFAPRNKGDVFNKSESLAYAIQKAFRGLTISDIIFYNVEMTPNYTDDSWYQFDVICQFRYLDTQ